jgi:hypothetical protein
MTKTIETKDAVVTYRCDQATKDAVFERLVKFFANHEAFSGEAICQCDAPQIDSIQTMAEIADNLMGFEITEK